MGKGEKLMEKDLSIIIPFVGEYPQVLFTVQATAQMLLPTGIDFEIIAVDNWCEQARGQAKVSAQKQLSAFERKYEEALKFKLSNPNTEENQMKVEKMLPVIEDIFEMHKSVYPTYENKSGAAIEACSRGHEWLQYVKYDECLSHWQAKTAGVNASSGRNLLFMDSHCVPSVGIDKMLHEYERTFFKYNEKGTFHMPLTYKILEWRRLIYKLVIDEEAFYSYSFTGFRPAEEPYEVPCMSTCGMMISRKIFDAIGGWPVGLGIYGGGENFMNYTLAVCGFKKWIYPHVILHHHGEKRDYHYIGDDTVKNRMIAHYLFGGEDLLWRFTAHQRGSTSVLQRLANQALHDHTDHRAKIKEIQKMTIEEWTSQWKGDDQ
jgi:hypothetical protein